MNSTRSKTMSIDRSEFEFEVLAVTGCKRRGNETWFEILWEPSIVRAEHLDRFLSEEISGVPLRTFAFQIEESTPGSVKIFWHRTFEPEDACHNCWDLVQEFLNE